MTNGVARSQPAGKWICNHCKIISFCIFEDSLIEFACQHTIKWWSEWAHSICLVGYCSAASPVGSIEWVRCRLYASAVAQFILWYGNYNGILLFASTYNTSKFTNHRHMKGSGGVWFLCHRTARGGYDSYARTFTVNIPEYRWFNYGHVMTDEPKSFTVTAKLDICTASHSNS